MNEPVKKRCEFTCLNLILVHNSAMFQANISDFLIDSNDIE